MENDISHPPLIVIRGSDICFLGIIRSCRAANIPVVAITFTWPSAPQWYSEYSDCLDERYEIANPFTDAELASDQLKSILQKLFSKWEKKLMMLPSSDTNYMFLLDYFEKFSEYICLMGDKDFAQPRYDVMHKASCSELLMSNAPEVVPKTLRCHKAEDIDFVVENMVFPAVYKPAVKDYGQTFYQKHDGNKAIEVSSAAELRVALAREIADGFDLVVQEKIFFDSVYDEIPFYLYADASGEIRMAANGIKELIEPFPYGTAIILRLAWFPELLELAKKVVNALEYRGILMIEFVKDTKDGRWKVIEVNPRHWLFNGFYQRQGINFTECLYRDMHGQLPEKAVVPAPSVLAEKPLHVDLQAVASRWCGNRNPLDLIEFTNKLSELDGQLSSPFYDLSDINPGLQRINEMVEKYCWDKNELGQLINKLN